MKDEKKIQEVVYARAKTGKRIGVFFIDVFLFFFTGFLLFSAFHPLVSHLPFYETNLQTRRDLQGKSGFYREDGTDIVSYFHQEASETEFPSARTKKDYLANALDAFYQNDDFLSPEAQERAQADYRQRKTYATYQDVSLFVMTDDAWAENEVNPEWLLSFYENEVNQYAQPLFVGYLPYLETTRVIWITSFGEAVVALTLAFALYFLATPLTLGKRGRKTLGMKLLQIGYVTSEGITPSSGKTCLHALFVYFIDFLVSFVSFLLPLFVSFGMMMLGKHKQTLSEYLWNWTAVDTKDQEVYLDYADFFQHEQARKEASIENKNFEIDHPTY